MASILIGSSSLLAQPGSTISQGADGSATANLTFTGTWAACISNLPSPLQAHPSFGALKLYEYVLTRLDGDLGSISCVYRGVLVESPSAYTQTDYQITQTSEPIETNAMFSYPRSSPPVSPAELAAIQLALDKNVVYSSTNPSAQLLYDKKIRGIESYLRIGGAFQQTSVSDSIPSIPSTVGKITTSLPTDCPSPTASGANYLFSGFSWRKSGGLVQISKSYTQSGPTGWDPDLYS